jgi:hypothetical protein
MLEEDQTKNAFLRAAEVEADRRMEPRFEVSGEVRLIVNHLYVPGRLLNLSDHGMRVEHMYSALTSGQVLQVQVQGQVRTAKVVWSRIREEGVQTGFYLL